MSEQLKSLYGNITAENAIREVTSKTQTGSLLVSYYDYATDTIFTANARADKESGPRNAFDRLAIFFNLLNVCLYFLINISHFILLRTFVKVNVGKLFQEQPPSL